jgi:hypothetical protein
VTTARDDASVVTKEFNRTVCCIHAIGELLDARGVGYIGLNRKRRVAALFECRADSLGRGRIDIRDDNPHAGPRKPLGKRFTDAAAAARDDGYFASKIAH